MKLFWQIVDYVFVIDGTEEERLEGHQSFKIAVLGTVGVIAFALVMLAATGNL